MRVEPVGRWQIGCFGSANKNMAITSVHESRVTSWSALVEALWVAPAQHHGLPSRCRLDSADGRARQSRFRRADAASPH
jgi:hypothetical protein